jgi:hypothetical protein
VRRHLVAREAVAAKRYKLVFGRAGAFTRPDPGHHLLTVFLVGNPDHLDVADCRVGVQQFLDLPRIDEAC